MQKNIKFGKVREVLMNIIDSKHYKFGHKYQDFEDIKQMDLPQEFRDFLVQKNLIEIKSRGDLSKELGFLPEEIREVGTTFTHLNTGISNLQEEIGQLSQDLTFWSSLFSKKSIRCQKQAQLEEKRKEYINQIEKKRRLQELAQYASTQDGLYVRLIEKSDAYGICRLNIPDKFSNPNQYREAVGNLDFDAVERIWTDLLKGNRWDIEERFRSIERVAQHFATDFTQVLPTYFELYTQLKQSRFNIYEYDNLEKVLREAHEVKMGYGGFQVESEPDLRTGYPTRRSKLRIKPSLGREEILAIFNRENLEESLSLLEKLSRKNIQEIKDDGEQIYIKAIKKEIENYPLEQERLDSVSFESQQTVHGYWEAIKREIETLKQRKSVYEKTVSLAKRAEERGIESKVIHNLLTSRKQEITEEEIILERTFKQIGSLCGIPDITPTLLEYFTRRRLGSITVQIPNCRSQEVSLKLENLLDHLDIPETESVCVYGSVLYKNFTTKKERRRKKWILFGPQELKILERNKEPDDFDVMVITKRTQTIDEKIIKPDIHTEIYSSDEGFYGHTTYHTNLVVEEALVTRKVRGKSFQELREKGASVSRLRRRAANLHIVYHSRDQFISGFERGDELSESVIRYGIPIIGRERFEHMIQDSKYSGRKPLHNIQWYIGDTGKLNGEIL